MAATQRGSSSGSVAGRGQPSTHPAPRRKNPLETGRDSAVRVKRFRELKATWRTDRTRLRVGIDVAQAEHVVHLRHPHTRVVVPTLPIPNTTRGFTQLWARIQQA
jgi:hypothetical protein